jgi:L-fuculose-phosphate aldolase
MYEANALRRDLVKYSRRIWERGWVANHDGNLSVRVDKNRILATPTAFSKEEVREDDLLLIEIWTGKVVAGRHRPFSELPLHLEFYQVRDDVQAVIHAHPPVASGFAIAGLEVEPRITPEAVVSLGDRIPLAPTVKPGSLAAKQQVRSLGALYDAFLLGNHGTLACGIDLEMAYLRTELVEHLAKMQQQAMILGNLRLIQDEWVRELMAKRKQAGLGPEARNAKVPPQKDLASLPVEEIISTMVEQLKK